jgi:hypothetical protein
MGFIRAASTIFGSFEWVSYGIFTWAAVGLAVARNAPLNLNTNPARHT